MNMDRRVALWNAINAYAAACGADTSKHVGGVARMQAVADVERLVLDAEESAVADAREPPEGRGGPRLTRRILRGILDSTVAHESGGPEDLTGCDDAESGRAHARVCSAASWARQMMARADGARMVKP